MVIACKHQGTPWEENCSHCNGLDSCRVPPAGLGEYQSCKKCGSPLFTLKHKGPHLGAYCSECETWFKFLPQVGAGNSSVASDKQQAFAVSLLDKWKRSGRAMTASQAGGIIKLFGGGR